MGREEIAGRRSVNERTVKREMAKLKTMGWVAVKRPAVSGRVAVYELDLKQFLIDTTEVWPLIGRDFQERWTEDPEVETNVAPFKTKPATPEDTDGTVWLKVQTILHGRDPELWSSWFPHLSEVERAGGMLP